MEKEELSGSGSKDQGKGKTTLPKLREKLMSWPPFLFTPA